MKFTLILNDNSSGGSVDIFPSDGPRDESFPGFLGYIHLDVEKPKKRIIKEAHCVGGVMNVDAEDNDKAVFRIPSGATNVKCTYEILE